MLCCTCSYHFTLIKSNTVKGHYHAYCNIQADSEVIAWFIRHSRIMVSITKIAQIAF